MCLNITMAELSGTNQYQDTKTVGYLAVHSVNIIVMLTRKGMNHCIV